MIQQILRRCSLAVCLSLSSLLLATNAHSDPTSASTWLQAEQKIALFKMFNNISPAGSAPGTVVASPSRTAPNYYFHWIRDAALVMDTVVTLYQTATNDDSRNRYRQALDQYTAFSRGNQTTLTRAGMGEPKFNMDGSAFNGEWGRPQNDGPALRALTLIRYSNLLLAQGEESTVRSLFYDGSIPTHSIIKSDLEFVSHHWQEASYDLWEEVKGDHFFTRMVQRKALLQGALLADRLNDSGAAQWYRAQATLIEQSLQAFWDPSQQIVRATLNPIEGPMYKTSGLDIAVILALLHGYNDDNFFSFSDPRIISTMEKLENSFHVLYPINHVVGFPGVAIGRYPEDRYAGTDFNGGNPWVLTTLAMAEAYYKLDHETRIKGQILQANLYREKAEQFILRVMLHADPNGSLSEQIDRNTGHMTSAIDLSWNYAAILTTQTASQLSF